MYQYFITVVPTRLVTHAISADTHQFSVTEWVSKAVNRCPSSLDLHLSFDPVVCSAASCCVFPGAGDKPRRGQSRCVGHLCEVRHQLSDGDGHRAAHAAVAVPGATVRNRRGRFLHDR